MVFSSHLFYFTPLHVACYKRNSEIIQLLLNFPGIDINIVDSKGVLFGFFS